MVGLVSTGIEEIYDRNVAVEKLKSGTKYERLTALVFQILDQSSLVVHDVTLRADGKESVHQIDVTASNRSGGRRRVIVEARDRQERVTLGQVRDFFGVVHQLRPDVAWIVSPSGFTGPAQRFAHDEGIRLAVLRGALPEEDNRVKAIFNTLVMKAMGTPTITTWLAADDAERARLRSLLASKVDTGVQMINAETELVYDAAGNVVGTLKDLLEPAFRSFDLAVGGNTGTHEFDETKYIDIADVRAAVRGFDFRVELVEAVHKFTIGNPDSVAELIIRSVDRTVSEPIDRLIYDIDLQGLAFGPDGQVVIRR